MIDLLKFKTKVITPYTEVTLECANKLGDVHITYIKLKAHQNNLTDQ